MKKTGSLVRTLAVAGTILVALPVVAPFVLGLMRLASGGGFLLDFLMPAELFPVVLVGAVLLLIAARMAHTRFRLVAWGLGLAIAMLAFVTLYAQFSGLADGRTEAAGLVLAVAMAGIAIFVAAVVEIAVAGVLLVRDLFRHAPDKGRTPPAVPAM